jgi:hypothetical protein
MSDNLQNISETKLVLDTIIASGAITMPLWVVHLAEAAQMATLFGGLLLLSIRIVIAWRELKEQNHGPADNSGRDQDRPLDH